MNIVTVKDLTKIYGKGENKVVALDHVNFEIMKGDMVAIIGKSGSGKSTLLHLLGAVDEPDSGSIIVDGFEIVGQKKNKLSQYRRTKVGIIYQFYNLVSVLNVRENIELPVLLDHKKMNQKSLDDFINMLGLKERENHLPNQLSGGQQQRVAIGRAMINSPALILADEPTGNLDEKSSADVMTLLKHFNKNGQTVVVVTHDPSVAAKCRRIIEIRDGRIESDVRTDNEEFIQDHMA